MLRNNLDYCIEGLLGLKVAVIIYFGTKNLKNIRKNS